MDSNAYIHDAPLLMALIEYADQKRVSFHMPGHQGGRNFPENFRRHLAKIDSTELIVTDDLNQPNSAAAKAMQAAAAAFGATDTLFVTGGSTTALYAMITAYCPKGSKIVIPRAVHRSVLNIAMLLDLTVVFIPTTKYMRPDRLVPITPPEASTLRLVLEKHPDARAILVTSPDYFGTCPDLTALAEIAGEYNCPLLVDEAHGAHLCFSPRLLPTAALAAGASACVQSAHKTLPALTQGAYLHLGADFAQNRPELQQIRRCLSLFQTSSPSLMIGASLDYARAFMSHSGANFIQSTLESIARFAADLSPVFHCSTADREMIDDVMRDPMRVVINVSETGYTGFALSELLAGQKIDVEMADLQRLVLIPDLIHAQETLPVVSAALNKIVLNHQSQSQDKAKHTNRKPDLIRLDQDFYRYLQTPVNSERRIESPLLSGTLTRQIPLAESNGKVLADALIPYPPGIAMVWPGEILTSQMLEMLRDLLDNGFCLHGMMHGSEGESLCVAH